MTITEATEVIRLWPDGPPTTIDIVGDEIAYPVTIGVAEGGTFYRNISDPTLTVFTPSPDLHNGKGIIVVPGGGWTINAWTHEGLDVATWLTSLGYTVFVLKYRVQASDPDQAAFEARQAVVDTGLAARLSASKLPGAISELITTDEYIAARDAAADDGRRAIAIVREEAGRFDVRPESIGMMGFSAGAYLTVDVAMDPRAEQLAWIAPIYGGETRGAPIPDDVPPMFTVVARDDILYRICEGLHADWVAAGHSSEHHVFARGAHGFGMIKQGLPSDRWTELFAAWLEDLPAKP